MFPKFFTKVNSMGAPVTGMLVLGVVQSLLALSTISPSLSEQFSALVNLAVVTNVIPYVVALSALPVMMRAAKVEDKVFRRNMVVTVVAMGYSVFALYASGKDAVMGGMLVMGVAYIVWGFIAPARIGVPPRLKRDPDDRHRRKGARQQEAGWEGRRHWAPTRPPPLYCSRGRARRSHSRRPRAGHRADRAVQRHDAGLSPDVRFHSDARAADGWTVAPARSWPMPSSRSRGCLAHRSVGVGPDHCRRCKGASTCLRLRSETLTSRKEAGFDSGLPRGTAPDPDRRAAELSRKPINASRRSPTAGQLHPAAPDPDLHRGQRIAQRDLADGEDE
jgi:hypothetical protein